MAEVVSLALICCFLTSRRRSCYYVCGYKMKRCTLLPTRLTGALGQAGEEGAPYGCVRGGMRVETIKVAG